jgi:hypothetical protein
MTFFGAGLIFAAFEAADANPEHGRLSKAGFGWHPSRWSVLEKGSEPMMKTLEVLNEAVRNPKHPFRKPDNQPKKSIKNRYERRKIKAYLNLADWMAEEPA